MNIIDSYLTIRGILLYNSFSKKFQNFNEDKIKKYQYNRVKKLLIVANNETEYYGDLFKNIDFNPQHDFNSLNDITKIPILTKDVARENRNRLINKNYNNKCLKLRTSGSTGEPFEINVSYNAWIVEQAVIWRHWKWAGYNFRDKMGILRSYVPRDSNNIIYKDRIRNFFYMSPFHMTPDNMDKYFNLIINENILVLRGYPSSLFIFAKYLKKCKRRISGIKFILTASEVLRKAERDLIEMVFNAKIFDHYGLADICVMMGECEQHKGLHNYEDYGYLELQEEGNGLEKIVGTNLHNYAMPLIRYDTGDSAIINNKHICPCCRNFPLIKKIAGRKDSCIRTSSGQEIPLVNFYTMFDNFMEIDKWQIVQENQNKIKFIISSINFSDERLKSLNNEITKRLPKEIIFKVEHNDNFVKTGEGKQPPFIRSFK
jgi:phenylacetate-CoA ligase